MYASGALEPHEEEHLLAWLLEEHDPDDHATAGFADHITSTLIEVGLLDAEAAPAAYQAWADGGDTAAVVHAYRRTKNGDYDEEDEE